MGILSLCVKREIERGVTTRRDGELTRDTSRKASQADQLGERGKCAMLSAY